MQERGYRRSFAAGCIVGSSVLGRLIPPSVFMIVWAILTEQSIGRLFAGGVLPGILLASLFGIYCVLRALLSPGVVVTPTAKIQRETPMHSSGMVGIVGVFLIVVVTLGGIWGGLFTPTEGSAFGLLGAVLLAIAKGMPPKEMLTAVREAGMVVTPIMFLLLGADLYSKLLALAGIPQLVVGLFAQTSLGAGGTILVMCAVWLMLGCFVDSIFIMLLTVPLFWPIAQSLQLDPIVFAIVGILVIEAGVLTPPFGIGAFVVYAATPDPELKLSEVFIGLAHYWAMLCVSSISRNALACRLLGDAKGQNGWFLAASIF